jgi:RHS repeat-associated protein
VDGGDAAQNYPTIDSLGRVLKSVQRMGTTDYVFNYTYDLNGFQTSVQYPSGKTVYYAQSQRGLPMIAAKDAAAANAYASVGSYSPGGGMTQMNGSNGAFVQEWDYNSRGQMLRVEAKVGGSTQFKALLGYGSTANNGNLLSQTITAGSGSFAQHFRYDAVNRLGLFVENPSGGSAPSDVNTTCASMSGSGTKCQKYGYDRFGNMWQSGANIALLDLVANGSGWYYNTAASPKVNNQLAFVGSAHDLAGNMVTYAPPSTVLWADYDVESRIAKLKVVDGTGATTAVEGEYFYDGEGLRIKKKAGNVTTVFVYDAGKQLMAEYEVGGTPVSGTKYLVADQLGSTRLLLDGSGAVVKRYDYVPFGGELARTGNSYDGVDAVKMKFTAKERDAERGLDFFGARYLAGSQGRWTSPDPYLGSMRAEIPQSFNRYSYVLNSPTNYIDPDGYDCAYVNSAGDGLDSVVESMGVHDCTKSGGYWVSGRVNSLTFDKKGRMQFGYSGTREDGTIVSQVYAGYVPPTAAAEDTWGFALGGSLRFLYDFLTGSGATSRDYDMNSAEGRNLTRSAGFQRLEGDIRNACAAGQTSGQVGFGSFAAAKSIPTDIVNSPVGGQVGGYGGGIWTGMGDSVNVQFRNVAGANSFFYHAAPNRTGTSGPFRSINQNFNMNLPITCGASR